MGKNSKKRRNAKKKRPMSSSLAQHQRIGRTLVPPLNRLPNMQQTRWTADRMPELLWACLVRTVIPRGDALGIFRQVAHSQREMLLDANLTPPQAMPWHTNLAAMYPQLIPRIVEIIAAHPLGYAAMRPLLLFDALPAREEWARAIGTETQEADADTLADAVAEYLWHQSEPATDVRWLCVMCAVITSQKVHFRKDDDDELVEGLRLYPDHGDLRMVRPSIRTFELSLSMAPGEKDKKYAWSEAFWEECHRNSPCIAATPEPAEPVAQTAQVLGPVVVTTIDRLSQHWINTSKTTDVDARHEGAFAFVLYALRCLLELVGKSRQRIAGRLLLRTMVECRITLAYLIHKNDDALWEKYRRYGSGQAKLALLKISEAERSPHSVSAEQLERIANEDVWEEFVDINLGNWAGADLRKMAEASGTKEIYDAHYGWSSGFAHGQWAAVRDASLTTCMNPLHRLHRIPLIGIREFGDVVPDAVDIVEAMIGDLLQVYPGADVSLRNTPAAEANRAEAESVPEDRPAAKSE